MDPTDNLYKIILSTNIDEPCKLEIILQNSWQRLEKIVSKTSDTNLNQVLSTLCVKSANDHETIQLGLLYRLLTIPDASSVSYRDITTTCRDNFQTIFKVLCSLISEYFFKMTPTALQQLFWFTNESLKNSLQGIDGIIYNMLRSLTATEGSRHSIQIHLQLIQSVVDLVHRNIKYFLNHPHLIRDTVTILLTLIPHHHLQPALFNQEVNVCSFLLNERFDECALIGRDLVRLLINVANINGFHKIWQRFISNPSQLSPNFTGPLSILARPTSKHLAMTCLSQKLDQYIVFLLRRIAQSHGEADESLYKHYFRWISKRIFSLIGDTSIIKPNIARYLILTNSQLENQLELNIDEDDVIHAKSVLIEWLLNISQNNQLEHSNIKLAVLYELVVFTYDGQPPQSTVEMTTTWKIVEAIYKRKPQLVVQLADFIPTLISQFIPSLKDAFKTSIHAALEFCFNIAPIKPFEYHIPKKQSVMPNNMNNIDKPNREQEVRTHLQQAKPEQNQQNLKTEAEIRVVSEQTAEKILDQKIKTESNVSSSSLPENLADIVPMKHQDTQIKPQIAQIEKQQHSNQRIEHTTVKVPKLDKESAPPNSFKEISKPNQSNASVDKKMSSLDDIDKSLQKLIKQAESKMSDWIEATNIITNITDHLICIPKGNYSTLSLIKVITDHLAGPFEKCIRTLYKKYHDGHYNTFDGGLDYSLFFMCPIFVLFKHMKVSSDQYHIIWMWVEALRQKVPLISFFILFFDLFGDSANRKTKTRKAKIEIEENVNLEMEESIYLKYILKWMNKTIEDALFDDMEQCSIFSHKLFSFSLVKIYRLFGSKMVEESRFIHLVVGSLDSTQIRDLLAHVVASKISLIPNEDIVDVIDDSLEWESFEQLFFWQILLSHNKLPLNQVWQILPELDWKDHAEAINAVIPLMKMTQPKVDIMKCLFARQTNGHEDRFILLILKLWEDRFEASVLSTLQSYLNLLKQNSKVERRNISSVIEQLSVIYANGHCQYIFNSPQILLSIDALRPHLPSTNKNMKAMFEYVNTTTAELPRI